MRGNRALVDVDTKLKENINHEESRARLSTTPQVPRAIAEVAQIIMLMVTKFYNANCRKKQFTIRSRYPEP